MDRTLWLLVAILLLWFLFRFNYARRKIKKNQYKGEEIQEKLRRLRKKRDEE
ncbi:hypothetical protein [Paenibacillus sp. GP183]|jgi:hypothetical protein|uniref:hypothetical protein n=1 Tax=Paenibacillus sp. GP183 TaxID=1882751 RepID=UPI00089842DC|nr:hypothetical protein [Paenibacillus sp. GP183]SEC65916.1 hypothetical protein SAMN05443246_4881 [Paenibacillus sp. GP183]